MMPFQNFSLQEVEDDIFERLKVSVGFEGVCKGRQGTVLVKPDEARGTPIVRTTTKYDTPAYHFQEVHNDLVAKIQEKEPKVRYLNNALIECYDNRYFRMGFHSDQAQDLEDESHIAIFSCYENPDIAEKFPRKLVVQAKEGNEKFGIIMPHKSVIIFSLATNRRFRHKIVLDTGENPPENTWLGVTFRLSKTFVNVHDAAAFLENGTRLDLADSDQCKEFYKLRRRENQEIGFQYPDLAYTISPSDLMPPRSVGEETSLVQDSQTASELATENGSGSLLGAFGEGAVAAQK